VVRCPGSRLWTRFRREDRTLFGAQLAQVAAAGEKVWNTSDRSGLLAVVDIRRARRCLRQSGAALARSSAPALGERFSAAGDALSRLIRPSSTVEFRHDGVVASVELGGTGLVGVLGDLVERCTRVNDKLRRFSFSSLRVIGISECP
jgi:hypothetical protein